MDTPPPSMSLWLFVAWWGIDAIPRGNAQFIDSDLLFCVLMEEWNAKGAFFVLVGTREDHGTQVRERTTEKRQRGDERTREERAVQQQDQ